MNSTLCAALLLLTAFVHHLMFYAIRMTVVCMKYSLIYLLPCELCSLFLRLLHLLNVLSLGAYFSV